jgi:hypothetical protein
MAQPKLSDRQALGIEILEILWSSYLLRRHMTGADDPVEAMRSVKILHLLSDDLVLRLCKLRDCDKRALTFHRVLEAARRDGLPDSEADLIDRCIAEFVASLGNLDELRNKHIAHRQSGHGWSIHNGTNITRAVELAVDITDRLCGERCDYRTAGLDLRAEVLEK